jgi:TolB-like protein/Flp pilus assembly protein TadD
MPVRRAGPAALKLSAKAIRHQLDRVLASGTFQQVDRLKRFLSFIVEEAAAGRGDQLKEYVIGVHVFGKEPQFDPRTDPIVRVQARRLRARLVRYYREEGAADEITVELPKGGYAPVFKRRDDAIVPKRSITAALTSRNTIAVLPFSDYSRGGELAFFCHGLTQEIIHRLTRCNGLRVMAARDDGSPTDAATHVSGSVRGAAEKARIVAQLVDATSGSLLWSESLDTSLEDPLAAEEAMAESIVNKLQPLALDTTPPAWGQRPPQNLAANNLYLQARYHLNQRTEETLLKAVEFFEKATIEDAGFALAHSGLADAYGLLAHYSVRGPADVWAKAASCAATAVMLDAHSAEAHTSLAHVKATQNWDWADAEREFKRAIGLNPRYPTGHHWFAMSCLIPLGRLDEALDEMLVAQSLDPVSTIIARDVAVVHFYRRDFASALDQCDHAIELNPHFSPAYHTLGLVQEQRQEFDEAVAALQRAVALSPHSPRMHSALGRALAMSERKPAAEKILRQMEDMARRRYVSPFDFATLHMALGHTDLLFKWLGKAAEDRAFDLLALKVDPRFIPQQDDRRFVAITKKLGLE